jgi:hypothetical protein
MNLIGVYFGPEGIELNAGDDNPKGVWERKDVHALNEFVLNSSGCAWNRVSPFDVDDLASEILDEFCTRARRIVLGMDAHRPWVMKDPRMCLVLPLWRRVLEAPVCIHVHRSPIEVAASLQTRNEIPMEVGLALWQKYVLSAHSASVGLPSITVAHRDLVRAPVETLRRLKAELEGKGVTGLRYPSSSEVKAFVDENLYRERDNRQDLQKYLGAPQLELFEAVAAGEKPPEHFFDQDVHMQELLSKYECSLPPIVTPQARRQADATRKEHELERSRKFDAMLPLLEDLKGILVQERSELIRALETTKAENSELTRAMELQNQQLKAHAHDITVLRASLAVATDAKKKADEFTNLRFHEIKQVTCMLREAEDEIGVLRGDLHSAKKQMLRQQGANNLLKMQVRTLRGTVEAERRLSEEARASLTGRATTSIRRISKLFKFRAIGKNPTLAREKDLVKRSGLFDETWYLTQNPDVRAGGYDPVEHYLEHGAREGRNPGPGFDTRYYLRTNPDVAAAGLNPLVHYILDGVLEGRPAVARRK